MVPEPFIMTDTISSCTLGVIKGAINKRRFNIYDFLCYDFQSIKEYKDIESSVHFSDYFASFPFLRGLWTE